MSTTEHATDDATSPRGKAPAGERIADWADGRLGIYGLAKANMRKIFPDHWSFMLGEICLYSFIIIILTLTLIFILLTPLLPLGSKVRRRMKSINA